MSPNPVSSNPILRKTLVWSGVTAAVLAILAGGIGFAVAGGEGALSGLLGVAIAVLFLAITGLSILIANRWYGEPLYVPYFFAIVLGGWLLKFVVFFVLLLIIKDQPWLVDMVFFLALVAGVLASLIIDAVALLKMRLPVVSDAQLPATNPEDEQDANLQNP
ncbi:hypothetical protein ACWGJP_13495 [Microbacterium sp. NPDC055903]